MSTTDLSILADAVTFAILIAIGGAIAYAVARAMWKRRSVHTPVKITLSALALAAVGVAGVAVWPTARETITSAANVAGFDVETVGDATDDSRAFVDNNYVSSPPKGKPARVFEAAPYNPGGLDLTPNIDPSGNQIYDPTDDPTGPDGPPNGTNTNTNTTTNTTTTTTTPPTTTPPTTTTPPATSTSEPPPPPPPSDTSTSEPPPPPPPSDTSTSEPPPPPPPSDTSTSEPPPSDSVSDSPSSEGGA